MRGGGGDWRGADALRGYTMHGDNKNQGTDGSRSLHRQRTASAVAGLGAIGDRNSASQVERLSITKAVREHGLANGAALSK